MPELGHMAYYVRNLERSVAFYQKVVGLTVVGRIFRGRAAVLSGGRSHHELLLIQVSTADGPLTGRRIGLYHAGWKVGAEFNDLQEALDRAHTHGSKIEGTADHGITFSIYLRDPDDNEVELFVDNPDYDWRQDSSWMEASAKSLDLSIPCLAPSPQAKPFLRQPVSIRRSTPVILEEAYHDDDQGGYATSKLPPEANAVRLQDKVTAQPRGPVADPIQHQAPQQRPLDTTMAVKEPAISEERPKLHPKPVSKQKAVRLLELTSKVVAALVKSHKEEQEQQQEQPIRPAPPSTAPQTSPVLAQTQGTRPSSQGREVKMVANAPPQADTGKIDANSYQKTEVIEAPGSSENRAAHNYDGQADGEGQNMPRRDVSGESHQSLGHAAA